MNPKQNNNLCLNKNGRSTLEDPFPNLSMNSTLLLLSFKNDFTTTFEENQENTKLQIVVAMVQKTVLKVNISCDKCKTNILKAVSGLQGVDKVEVDGAKGTLSVTGDADPYDIIVKTRKVGKFAEVVSIGPPPKPQEKKPEEKKPEGKKPEEKPKDHVHHTPFMCPICERVPVIHMTRWEEPTPQCNIL